MALLESSRQSFAPLLGVVRHDLPYAGLVFIATPAIQTKHPELESRFTAFGQAMRCRSLLIFVYSQPWSIRANLRPAVWLATAFRRFRCRKACRSSRN